MHDQVNKGDDLLRYIYELSRGDTELIIHRKPLGEQLGLSSREARAALKALTKKGMIRPILFGSLCITPMGVAEVERKTAQAAGEALERPGASAEDASVVTILFLSADPTNVARLRVGKELREIGEKLQLSKMRERFKLEQRMSVRPADLTQAMLDTQPQIVHFSGHGSASGALCFEDDAGRVHRISAGALTALFEQFADQVKCVVLNACYSEAQARVIAEHVGYVIGMSDAIGDRAAIAFATGFYQGMGAGRSIQDAYKLGCVQIMLQGIPEHLTPTLVTGRPSSRP